MVMKITVPRETQVENLTRRLKQGGLGIIARDGEYYLVLRSQHQDIFPPEVTMTADIWDQPVDVKDPRDLSP